MLLMMLIYSRGTFVHQKLNPKLILMIVITIYINNIIVIYFYNVAHNLKLFKYYFLNINNLKYYE